MITDPLKFAIGVLLLCIPAGFLYARSSTAYRVIDRHGLPSAGRVLRFIWHWLDFVRGFWAIQLLTSAFVLPAYHILTSRQVTLVGLGVILGAAGLIQTLCCRHRGAVQAPLGFALAAVMALFPLPLALITIAICVVTANAFRLGSAFFLAIPIAPAAFGWWLFPNSYTTYIVVSAACALPPIVGFLLDRDMVVPVHARVGDA